MATPLASVKLELMFHASAERLASFVTLKRSIEAMTPGSARGIDLAKYFMCDGVLVISVDSRTRMLPLADAACGYRDGQQGCQSVNAGPRERVS